jgi:hypothetical protein
MIVADLDDEFGLQWLPVIFFPDSIGLGHRERTRETRRGDQFFELFGQRWTVSRGDAGRKADMMQQALRVVEAQKRRAHGL